MLKSILHGYDWIYIFIYLNFYNSVLMVFIALKCVSSIIYWIYLNVVYRMSISSNNI